jgi:hypothetical protein
VPARGVFASILAVVSGCTARAVPLDDGGSADGSGDASLGHDDDGVDHGQDGGSDDDGAADPSDDATDTDPTAGAPACGDPNFGDVTVEIWPGSDPTDTPDGRLRLDVDCEIGHRDDFGPGVILTLPCKTADHSPLTIEIELWAPALAIPESVALGIVVQLSVSTWRDPQWYDEDHSSWMRADHFVLSFGGEILLAAGAGTAGPSTAEGTIDRSFYAPMYYEPAATDCPAYVDLCGTRQPGGWQFEVGDEVQVLPPYSATTIGDFAVHAGEIILSATDTCDTTEYTPMGFAFAQR